jgi:hypothetical protein
MLQNLQRITWLTHWVGTLRTFLQPGQVALIAVDIFKPLKTGNHSLISRAKALNIITSTFKTVNDKLLFQDFLLLLAKHKKRRFIQELKYLH